MTVNQTTETNETKTEFTREEKINRAARKMLLEPLGLKWFKFFKYFIIPAQIIISAISIIILIFQYRDLNNIFNDPEIADNILDRISGALTGVNIYIVFAILILIANIILAIKTFRGMSVLDLQGYKTLSCYLLFIMISSIVSTIIWFIVSTILYAAITDGYSSASAALECVIDVIRTVVWFGLNKYYFNKRYDLFTDWYLCKYVECPYCHALVINDTESCESCGENF